MAQKGTNANTAQSSGSLPISNSSIGAKARYKVVYYSKQACLLSQRNWLTLVRLLGYPIKKIGKEKNKKSLAVSRRNRPTATPTETSYYKIHA